MRVGLALVLASGCGDSTTAMEPTPYVQPRLATVGTAGTVTYDGDLPATITALYADYSLRWASDGALAHATATFTGFDVDHVVELVPTYQAGRLASLTSSCTGACVAAARTDAFSYDGDRLRDWTVTGFGTSHHYAVDALERVVAIDGDAIAYGDGPCPRSVVSADFHSTPTYDASGRIASDQGYAVDYDGPHLVRFEGTGAAFQDLTYASGEAVGIDLSPGLFDGGPAYGFPLHGELWRLDGTCDPTMTSQATILALALTAALREATPATGG